MAPRSVTTTEPICRLFMRAVASVKELSAAQVTGGEDINSWTAVGTLVVLSSGSRTVGLGDGRRSASSLFAPDRPV